MSVEWAVGGGGGVGVLEAIVQVGGGWNVQMVEDLLWVLVSAARGEGGVHVRICEREKCVRSQCS